MLIPTVLGVLLPVAVAAIAVLSISRRSSADPPASPIGARNRVLAGAAVGIGFSVGLYGVSGWPGFPPSNAWNWLFFLAPALVLGVAALAIVRAPRGWVGVFVTGLSGLCLWWIIRPILEFDWSTTEAAAWIIVLLAAVAMCGWSQQSLSKRTGPSRVTFILMLWAIAVSIALVICYSALMGQLAGCVAAALGPCWLLGWRMKRDGEMSFGGWIASALLIGLMTSGHFYGSLYKWTAIALVFVPLAPWLLIAFGARGLRLLNRPFVLEMLVAFASVSVLLATRAFAVLDESGFWDRPVDERE